MGLWIQLIAISAALLAGGCNPLENNHSRQVVPELELVNAWPVESTRLLEPSGLTRVEGVLYTVADKIDDTLFRIRLEDGVARLDPHIRFRPPGNGSMDWEGVTADQTGTFYLIAERQARLLRLTSDGTAAWAGPSLLKEGRQAGLFSKINAGFEGVAWIGPHHWLAAAEREPRGLVEWWETGEDRNVEASLHLDSPFKSVLPLLRLPDYSGLCADGDKIYALFRNAHLVVRLEKDATGWRETAAWSYRHIETRPDLAYRSQTYGQAEGIVVEGQDVYLIFDNNLGPRQADPRDRRPLLIHARFPE
jgi:hypothetical protein